MDVVVEANLEFTGGNILLAQSMLAASHRKNRAYEIKDRAELSRFCIGAEPGGAIPSPLAGKENSRKRFIGNNKVGIGFIVLEVDVVAGLELLDQIVFKNQRLNLRGGDNNLKILNMGDQYQCFSEKLLCIAEVGANPVTEVLGFADVDYPATCISELVNPG